MSVINTNVKALAAQESMRSSNLSMSQAMERLSTGKKINSAKDDAAGLAITNRMTTQIRGYAKAIGNANDAISMSQTAEGAIGNVGDILQRMRELAVQAGSGTMSDADRSNMQLEVTQLKQEIDNIAKNTNHNNIKLLDGSAQNITIQSGVNSGDTMKIGFDSMKTKDIGVGSRASMASVGGLYSASTTFDALSAGALLLNGVAVGASLTADDSASSSNASVSAIAKAAAINKVASLSGVYAKADANTVSGSAMTAAQASGYVTINGVNTDTFSTSSTSNALSRNSVVAAINAKTAITGVTAIDTQSDELGINLVAADGRNITVDATTGGLTASGTGLSGTNGTYVGSYNLYTLDGRDIDVSFKDGSTAAEAMSGLRNGTYASDTATFTTLIRTAPAAATAPTSALQGLLNANSMIINGVAIGQALATDDTASATGPLSSTREASAIAIAAAINRKSTQTGVTATAAPNVLRGSGFTATQSSSSIYLNGVFITANSQTRNGLIDSINSYANQTGVVASAWGAGVQYTAADGRNISIGASAGNTALGLTDITIGTSNTSITAITFYSQVTLNSDSKFTVEAGSNGVTNLENLGFRQGTFGGSDNGLKVNQIDVTTISGASQALTALDAAINTISAAQAKSGALNNRLDVIVSNLSESNQNMQASRSRILDTDYASETTSLAKQQIIQQAATAMLAQANQSSQSILSLLK
jgi:flagellin